MAKGMNINGTNINVACGIPKYDIENNPHNEANNKMKERR
jgi:hypothetical protein